MLYRKCIYTLALLVLIVMPCSCQKGTAPVEQLINQIGDINYDRFKGNEMVIITVNKFLDELQPFILYKKSIGMNIEVNTSAAPSGADAVKNVLLNKFRNGGLQFIILVGDIEDVPSPYFQGAPSDPSYALLEGNDLIGDALISRISVKNNSELKNIVNKLLIYQKGLFENKDWITKAIVVGTSQFDGVNHTSGIANSMRNHTSYFSSIHQILETDSSPHSDLMNEIENNGANMIVYNSHGFADGFHSIEFTKSNIQELTTFGQSFPFIHGAACLTGSFEWSGGDCFAEAILKTGTYEKPAGAIGMLAFSRSTSSTPAMAAQRIAFKEVYYNEKIVTIGELCYFSNLLTIKDFNISESEPFYKHWHLFGDCSAPIWKHIQ